VHFGFAQQKIKFCTTKNRCAFWFCTTKNLILHNKKSLCILILHNKKVTFAQQKIVVHFGFAQQKS
jgi:hypothetical protein